MSDNLFMLISGATTIVKLLIDLVRVGMDPPRWLPPLLAVGGGILVVIIMQVAAGVALTQQVIAEGVLAGILSGGAAVGVTEMGRRADTRRTPSSGGTP